MTISTTTSRISYNGNGVTTVFSVPFRFFASTDLVVQLVTISTGVSTALTLGTHYSVTGADDEDGGSLTMVTAPAVGQRLVIRRVIPATQEVDYIAGDPFPAETHERALDRLTMLAQQTEEVSARALMFPPGDESSGQLPEVATRASNLLGFDNMGNLTVSAPASGSSAELALDLAGSGGSGLVGFDWVSIPAAANKTDWGIRTATGGAHNVLRSIPPAQWAAIFAGTTTYNATADIAAALALVPDGGTLYFPAGVYFGHLLVRRSNITIMGAGSASTTIKIPAGASTTQPWEPGGTVSGVPNCIEVGQLAMGNLAAVYTNVRVQGFTLDGNKANNTAPVTDLFGLGLAFTQSTHCSFDDIRAVNCHGVGIGAFINSNHIIGSGYVENCGFASSYPGFDLNSSKYGIYDIVTKDCFAGGRLLDNCWGNHIRLVAHNSTNDGFIYGNQAVNQSHTNNIDVTVYTCGQHGFNIGSNCSNSQIRGSVFSAAGIGCLVQPISGSPSFGNSFDVVTKNGASSGLFVGQYATDNSFEHLSNTDGLAGAPGTSFAFDIGGQRNNFDLKLNQVILGQARGITMRATALDNEILSYTFTNTTDPFSDGAANTRTKYNRGVGRGVDIASATTITIPINGTVFYVTGTTSISGMAGVGLNQPFTLVFQDPLTVVRNIVLRLNTASLVATAGSTLTGIWDGTSFYETGRSVA